MERNSSVIEKPATCGTSSGNSSAWEEETQGAHVIYLALLHFFPNVFLYNMTGYRFLPLATDG